jgi:superfamily II DNA or RNA helicase
MEILHPRIGDRVRVRQAPWRVQDIHTFERCRVLTLSGTTPGGRPRVCCVLQPFDDVEGLVRRRSARRVSARAWRHTCLELMMEDGGAAALRTAASARIDLLPYQLEPALALLRGEGARVLIADEVGLGKTVQALIAIAELRARGIVERALVICPAGLREQWVEEARVRFQLPFSIFDQAGVRRARAHLPLGVNPWATEPLVASSIDFLKRPEVMRAVSAANWDMVVVDEAHGACGHSERHDAVSLLCRRAAFVLLLTATPHNGDEDAFASLRRLGRHDDNLVVFRRSRLEAGRDAGRRVHRMRVTPTAPERRMYAALRALTRAIRHEKAAMDRHVWLVLSLLHKRALSSAFALAESAERRLQMMDAHPSSAPSQLLLPIDDETGELDAADAAPMWGMPALVDVSRERRLLHDVAQAARQAQGTEAKLGRLRRLLGSIREPAIVFTEYRDTLVHVRNQVAPNASVIHGGMTAEQRREALHAFPDAGVLLATDAAGEGLNLQQQCRCVINLELPWNPMRLEQRIGRVDRIGQRARVHVFQLVMDGTYEPQLLDRLSARVARADARVGAPHPLCGRPEWTEDASARLMVFREETAAPHAPPDRATTSVPLTRLEADGHR